MKDTKTSRSRMEKAVQSAIAGDLEWVDELIRDAGYINPSLGMQQNQIIQEKITSRKILRDWEREGLESETIGRKKYYPLWLFIKFLFDRRNSQSSENEEYRKWAAEDKRQSALARKLKNDETNGLLIDRKESDQKFVELVLHVITSMETAFGGLAPQLVNKNVNQVRKEIEKRIDWLCQEMQQNRTPVPSKLAGEQVKRICREELEKIG